MSSDFFVALIGDGCSPPLVWIDLYSNFQQTQNFPEPKDGVNRDEWLRQLFQQGQEQDPEWLCWYNDIQTVEEANILAFIASWKRSGLNIETDGVTTGLYFTDIAKRAIDALELANQTPTQLKTRESGGRL